MKRLLRRHSRLLAAAAVVPGVGAVVVSAGYFQFNPAAGVRLKVPTSEQVTYQPAAVANGSGTVHAVRHGDLVCYEAVPGGQQLVFPQGFTASPDLQLRDPSGEVVATPDLAVGFSFSSERVRAPAACGAAPARAVVQITGLRA